VALTGLGGFVAAYFVVRVMAFSVEFNLDSSIKVPDKGVWYVLFHRYPWHHVEATPYKRMDLAFE
jgi:hypothetical protein